MARSKKIIERPDTKTLKAALKHERYRRRYRTVAINTVFTLITVAAAVVLLATLLVPILRIYGTSMTPTLEEGDIVLCVKSHKYETGDLVAFYYQNKLLVKRVIAGPGDWVNIDAEGNVTVNNEPLDEPYVSDKSLGDCDIEFPYQVPESRWFLMGDHRSVSVDSRSTVIGCVSDDSIVGKILFRLWPFEKAEKFS